MEKRPTSSSRKKQKEKLLDKTSLERLYLKVVGLEVEITALRERSHNYERAILILDRVRIKLHKEGILTEEDMKGLDEEFDNIPMDIRKMEIDHSSFLTPIPRLEHK